MVVRNRSNCNYLSLPQEGSSINPGAGRGRCPLRGAGRGRCPLRGAGRGRRPLRGAGQGRCPLRGAGWGRRHLVPDIGDVTEYDSDKEEQIRKMRNHIIAAIPLFNTYKSCVSCRVRVESTTPQLGCCTKWAMHAEGRQLRGAGIGKDDDAGARQHYYQDAQCL